MLWHLRTDRCQRLERAVADIEPLRGFIRQEFLFDRDAELGDDMPLFPDVIDSLGVLEVVEFVEEHFGIVIDEEELLADNFRTVKAISQLVDRHV